MNDKSFLGTEPIHKLLFRLAIPTVVAQLINMLYNIVDRIYIGPMPANGSLALTGVSEANLEHVVLVGSYIAGRSGGSEHEHALFISLSRNSDTGSGGNGAQNHHGFVVHDFVVGVDGLFGVVLVVLNVQNNLQAALGVDFVNGFVQEIIHLAFQIDFAHAAAGIANDGAAFAVADERIKEGIDFDDRLFILADAVVIAALSALHLLLHVLHFCKHP